MGTNCLYNIEQSHVGSLKAQIFVDKHSLDKHGLTSALVYKIADFI